MRPAPSTWFFLRREPLYHKLQYSKVPKYDSSAAILGTVLGAFAGYLALATVGSGGTDLTDLTALVTWALVGLGALALSMETRNHHSFVFLPPLALWVAPFASLISAIELIASSSPAHPIRLLRRVWSWAPLARLRQMPRARLGRVRLVPDHVVVPNPLFWFLGLFGITSRVEHLFSLSRGWVLVLPRTGRELRRVVGLERLCGRDSVLWFFGLFGLAPRVEAFFKGIFGRGGEDAKGPKR